MTISPPMSAARPPATGPPRQFRVSRRWPARRSTTRPGPDQCEHANGRVGPGDRYPRGRVAFDHGAHTGPMPVTLHHVVVDAHDLPKLARFWTQALGWTVLSERALEI